MRMPLLKVLLTAALLGAVNQTLALQPATAAPASMAIARDAVLPHVVSILVVRQDFSGGEARLSLSGGTGTIVSASGHIATNAHVTENGQRFRVVLNDQREFPAKLIGTDAVSDLAVLKIVAPADTTFGYASFATNVQDLKPGETVLAMGAPWGMRDSVSAGVINNVNRLMVSLFEDEADYEQSLNESQATARYYAWIQHDASISPGNSGGPLVDLRGRIVGVNTRGSVFGGDMAFSIPAPVAKNVVDTLIAKGKVTRSDFGFGVRSLRGTGLTSGALIADVDRGSAAEKAGLKPGDRLLTLDNVSVNLNEPEEIPSFRRGLTERTVGALVALEVERAGKTMALKIASVEQNDAKPREVEVAHFGISVSEVTTNVARARYLETTDGVLVQGLRTGGPAATAQPSILAGDRITHVNGTPIKLLSDFLRLSGNPLEGAETGAPVTLTLDRRGQNLLALLTPAPKRLIPPVNPELDKSWAGWEVQPVPVTLATELKLPEGGFRVTRIYPSGPALAAGVKVGDLITATGVNPANPVKPSGLKETSALDLRVRNAERNAPFAVTIMRGTTKMAVNLTLTEEPKPAEKTERRWNERLSVTLRAITFYDRIERQLKDSQRGVILERVENGGYGGLAHLREGDLLVRVGQNAVEDLSGFERALVAAERSGADKLSFLVMRGSETRLLFVDAPWREVK
jgi:S1-C subfamily serine protease